MMLDWILASGTCGRLDEMNCKLDILTKYLKETNTILREILDQIKSRSS